VSAAVLVKSAGRQLKRQLQERKQLPMWPPVLHHPAGTASATPPAQTLGSQEGDRSRARTLEPDAIRVGSRGCGGFRIWSLVGS
jgi:hypothetical protein